MTNPAIHPARRCINCAHLDEDGCQQGFPEDAVSCTEHQTLAESDADVSLPNKPPAAVFIPSDPKIH